MMIDLNGMLFHLNVLDHRVDHRFRAEIVDEAFNFQIIRKDVVGLDGISDLIHRYTDIRPRSHVLTRVAQHLENLHAKRRQDGFFPAFEDADDADTNPTPLSEMRAKSAA